MLSLLPASALSLSLFCSFSAPSNTILFPSPSQPLLSVHRRPRPKMSTESVIKFTCLINMVSNLCHFIHRDMVDRTSQIWSDHNLHHFILRGMVDRTSLIWSGRNLCHFIVCAWLTVSAYYGTSGHEDGYFRITKHLYGSIRKFIMFVCT